MLRLAEKSCRLLLSWFRISLMAYPGRRQSAAGISWLRKCGDLALDGLYPRHCRSCEGPLPSLAAREGLAAWLCGSCEQSLEPIIPPVCSVCGEPYDGALTSDFRCWNCEGRKVAFDFAISAYKASGALRELIHGFKYGHDLSLRGVLAEILRPTLDEERLIREDLTQWLLVPVPLYFFRQMGRGFNQSWEICQRLSQMTGIPAAEVLRRTRHTGTQASLHRRQRLENLRGIFALKRRLPWLNHEHLKGRQILLVDDVLTTGATAHECARVLKRDAGVEKVVVITVARG